MTDLHAPCNWLVELPNPLLTDERALDAGWYPDSVEDMTVVVECGAPAVYFAAGGFRCDNGHSMGTLEEELGPYGNEWQREQSERSS